MNVVQSNVYKQPTPDVSLKRTIQKKKKAADKGVKIEDNKGVQIEDNKHRCTD